VAVAEGAGGGAALQPGRKAARASTRIKATRARGRDLLPVFME
jgi:hypothetical protein